jgi:hypothetical protein
MNSKALKPILLHGVLVAIGLAAGTFSNHANNTRTTPADAETSVAEVELPSTPVSAVHEGHLNEVAVNPRAVSAGSKSDTTLGRTTQGRKS